MLVHRMVTPSIKFAGTHLYTWLERGTVRVKCLAQEHNTMSPARARTQTARSGHERTNHEAKAPPTKTKWTNCYIISFLSTSRSQTCQGIRLWGFSAESGNKQISIHVWSWQKKLCIPDLEIHLTRLMSEAILQSFQLLVFPLPSTL